MKEKRTETVMIRRLSPGLALRIVLGSKSSAGACGLDVCGISLGGRRGSVISAIVVEALER